MTQIQPWYFDWAQAHCDMFRLGEDDLRALLMLAVEPACWQARFSAGELQAASGVLARSDEKLFPSDHRPRLVKAIEHARQIASDAAQACGKTYAATYGVCALCDNMGLVVVPSARCLAPNDTLRAVRMVESAPGVHRAVYETIAVCCTCPVGQKSRASSESANRPQLTLEQYEKDGRPRSVWQAANRVVDRLDRPVGVDPPPAPTPEQVRRQVDRLVKGIAS